MRTKTLRCLILLGWLLLAVHGLAQNDLPDDTARIHYTRPDGNYEGWTLHVWEDTTDRVTWQDGLEIAGDSDYGVYWHVNLTADAERVGFIVHRGDEKDPGPDMFLRLDEHGREIWLVSGSDTIHTERPDLGSIPVGDLGRARAHWVDRATILWSPAGGADVLVTLHASADASLDLTTEGVDGGESFLLERVDAGVPSDVVAKFPHLASLAVFRLPADAAERAPELLRGQLALTAASDDGLVDATALQIPGVLDDLFTFDGPLGLVWQGDTPRLSVWAPTARNVRLHLFDGADGTQATTLDMQPLGSNAGVWSIAGEPSWDGRYYLYEVEVYVPSTRRIETNLVTDPYSVSLAMNSARSQIVRMSDADLEPSGWHSFAKPPLERFADVSIYELHVRDFSAFDDRVPEDLRGTFEAFTLDGTHGIRHLQALAEAGLTHLHLLPTFDIATIDEDRSRRWTPPHDLFEAADPASLEPRNIFEPRRDEDAFNWGYDPWHFNVPEGSYSTDPDGPQRILEYRRMVQALNEMGLRVAKDVVYNHTNASGQSDRSVFDRIVPGYYHRLNADGFVETSTCCPNTATEHAMMERFMIDSLVFWAREYKIDAFRFDLMGHHMVENMIRVRDALDALTMEQDGVDGRAIYVYGEGWNFGEVADGRRGVNATQRNVGGLGIGTFNDRMRDAIRGGGPFDGTAEMIRNQGFVSGLYTRPNRENPHNTAPLGEAQARERLLHYGDLIRIGLAGNLADFEFENARGDVVPGSMIDYNGSPAGYALSPTEVINYVEKHDNQTLFDQIAVKAPLRTSMEDRVRMQNLATSMVLLSQGVPFLHAGQDLLRSKSLERDSYNSGDWWNRIDWTMQSNNWGVGVPPNLPQDAWRATQAYLALDRLAPEPRHIERAADHAQEMLRVRYSTPLFRLGDGAAVMAGVRFANTGPDALPGVIAMIIEDVHDVDPRHDAALAVFNATPDFVTLPLEGYADRRFALHPDLRASSDPLVGFARFRAEAGSVLVPPYTTAVFLEPRR